MEVTRPSFRIFKRFCAKVWLDCNSSGSVVPVWPLSQGLDGFAPFLRANGAAGAVAGGACGAAPGSDVESLAKESGQTVAGGGAVAVLAPVLGGFDEDHPAFEDAPVGVRENAFAHGVGDVETVEVAAQLHGAGGGVDTLPARAGGAHGREAERVGGDSETGIDAKGLHHDPIASARLGR